MVPAHQRLDADHAFAVGGIERLKLDRQFFIGQRTRQIALRGVLRLRRAISVAARSSITTASFAALRRTISVRSSTA
jgi:hypothetical protein